MIFKVKKR